MSLPKEFRERIDRFSGMQEFAEILDDLIGHRLDAFEEKLERQAEANAGSKSKK